MKIFNWVHRKLIPKDASHNAKKDPKIGDVDDQQFLVDNNGFGDVFDDWKGGILTIGTFGYHPLKEEDNENEILDLFEEEDHMVDDEMTDSEEEKEENDEVKPLVYADYNAHDYKRLLEIKTDETDRAVLKHDFEIELELELDVKKEIRTTLADLFCADSEETRKKEALAYEGDDKKIKDEFAKNKDHEKHGGLSFQKKLIKGEAARPIQKINKLMRRMLKRKIHPGDLGLNKDEIDSPNNPNAPAHKCGSGC